MKELLGWRNWLLYIVTPHQYIPKSVKLRHLKVFSVERYPRVLSSDTDYTKEVVHNYNLYKDLIEEPDTVFINSLFNNVPWTGPTLISDMLKHSCCSRKIRTLEPCPHGIHAHRHKTILDKLLNYSRLYNDYEFGAVTGLISLLNTVVEGRQGYQAEAATVRKLYVERKRFIVPISLNHGSKNWKAYTRHIDFDFIAKKLSDRYQCEVKIR